MDKAVTKRFNIYEKEHQALRKLAFKRQVTYSTLVREAIQQYLDRQGFGPFPERRVIPR